MKSHLACCAFLLLSACAEARSPDSVAIEVRAEAVPRNPEDPAMTQLGALRYRGGLVLTSEDDDFGGLSGVIVAPDESKLLAITDKGHWVCMGLKADSDGVLLGITTASLSPMLSAETKPLQGKEEADAEAVSLTSDGTAILAAFEGTHRVMRYPLGQPGNLCSVAGATPTRLIAPAGLNDLPANGGIEALATTADGTLIVLTEKGEAEGGGTLGWMMPELGLKASAAQRFGFEPPDPYVPTDLARLDDTLFVLQRHFSVMSGVSGVLSMTTAQALAEGTAATELARFVTPITVDNMEGVSAVRSASGQTHIYIVSDDNFMAFQRTLLLKFSLGNSKD